MSRLPPLPNTHIDEAGLIHGDDFNDSYFSRDNGLDESRTVFLSGCGLPEAWANRSCFVIGELGFGTGLNVLAVWDLWNKTRPPSAILHIITVEGFLLEAQTARAAHTRWPELKHLSDQLIAKWPVRAYGAQRVWFPEDGVCITYLVGPCEDALGRMNFSADCWFLDGFSPARNPDMWSQGVFQQIARLSAPAARVGTYSVAGAVKAGLRDAGFTIARKPGFGAKRERLEAYLMGTTLPDAKRPKTAIIVGGGIAGACIAAALGRRNISCELFDADPCGQTKASGNPIALIMPRLDRADTSEARFFRAAYLNALDAYQDMGDAFEQKGVWEVRAGVEALTRLADLRDDPPLPPSQIEGTPQDGLLHLKGGLAYPDLVLKHLTQAATCHPVAIDRLEFRDGVWCAIDTQGANVATADICVIAGGTGAPKLCDFGAIMRGRAGQLSWAPIIGEGDLPERPLSGGAYAAPFGNKVVFGATFDPSGLDDAPPRVTAFAHERNRDMLAIIAPEIAGRLAMDEAAGRASVRATTPDQLPMAGATDKDESGKFILCGLGSRGFTTAYLCAEMIASQACGEPSPVEARIVDALAPNRFLRRAAKRQPKLAQKGI